jgi:peptide/nickel transport system ATP-binding protein
LAGSGTVQLRDDSRVLLRVEHLVVEFPVDGKRKVQAVSDVSFDVLKGETLGLVGESGCGKSTAGLTVVHLVRANGGKVTFDGTDLTALSEEELRRLRPEFQIIFQDPLSSLNPRRNVDKILNEPLEIWQGSIDPGRIQQRAEMLEAVGLDPGAVGDRRPNELSGGQSQRVCIARALMLQPALLVCDEPVSSLDVSVQAQILNLLEDLKERYELTLVFIAHDLAVVKNISDRIAVMYLGKLCEIGEVNEVFSRPAHPYTTALLESVPDVEKVGWTTIPPLRGEVPSPVDPPSGCRFRTRCPRATELCAQVEPPMRRAGPDHFAACHHPLIPLEPAGERPQ